MHNEQQLIQRLQTPATREQAFETLVKEFQEQLYWQIRRMVLDHDDTTVDSTRAVNYPQFCEAMARFRPHMEISEAQFFRYCFDPGFYGMCEQVLRYTPEEMEAHVAMWKEYHKTHHPQTNPTSEKSNSH